MKKGALIGLICGIVAMLIVVVGVGAAVLFNTPTARVIKGTTKLFAQIEAQNDIFGNKIDFDAIQKINGSGRYQNEMSLNMDVDGLDDFSIGVDTTVLCDNTNEKMKEEISISLAYYELLSIQMAVDKTDAYLDIPMLYDGSITFSTQNLGEQFKNSIFYDLYDFDEEEIADDFSLNFFENNVYDVESGIKELFEIIKSAKITKDDSEVTVTVGNRAVSCNGYLIVLKKDDINQLLESMAVNADSVTEVKEDVELFIYMDKKNNIKQIQTGKDIEINGSKVSVALRLEGVSSPLDSIKGKIGLEEDGENYEVNFDYSGVKEGKKYNQTLQGKVKTTDTDLASIAYDAEWDLEDAGYDMEVEMNLADMNFKVDMKGSVETDSSGFYMNFDDCDMYMDHEKLADFSGTYSIEPLTEEIEMPSGETHAIFEFSETEFLNFVMDMTDKLDEYYDMFDNFSDLF